MERYVALARKLALPVVLLFWFFSWLATSSKNARALVIGGAVALIVGGVIADLALPDRHIPWRPLGIDERPGFATSMKLRFLALGPDAWCSRLLERSSSLQVLSLDAFDGKDRCGWSNGVHIVASGSTSLTGKPPYAMACPLAAGAHIWVSSVDRRAREILGSHLVRMHHAGTYSCRRMYNRTNGRMSQHAFANAWDVTGFELADGRVVSVQKHWKPRGPERKFLRAVRDDACDVFNVVLGPEFNSAHHDHFHVDMGNGIRCR